MNLLSIAVFHNNEVSVVYDETMFHVISNVSIVSVINEKTIFQVVLIISVVSLVSDEIVFGVVLKISVVNQVNNHNFWPLSFGNAFLMCS